VPIADATSDLHVIGPLASFASPIRESQDVNPEEGCGRMRVHQPFQRDGLPADGIGLSSFHDASSQAKAGHDQKMKARIV
jgi:hypothetical protein